MKTGIISIKDSDATFFNEKLHCAFLMTVWNAEKKARIMPSLFFFSLTATVFLMIVSNNEKCITSIAWSSGCFSVIVKYYCLGIFLPSFSAAWCFCHSKDGLIYGLACRMRKTWFIHCWRKIALHVETLLFKCDKKWSSVFERPSGCLKCVYYVEQSGLECVLGTDNPRGSRNRAGVGGNVFTSVSMNLFHWLHKKGSKTCKIAEAKKEKKNK